MVLLLFSVAGDRREQRSAFIVTISFEACADRSESVSMTVG